MWIPTGIGRSKVFSVLMWTNIKLPGQQVIRETYHPRQITSMNITSAINCLLQESACKANNINTTWDP
ncbi:hypothetical protein XENTR_v10020767 [Xenopus tropicalis]|nr:hypothetical protein XENTR_v10020767 [Xenopus tropicalis]